MFLSSKGIIIIVAMYCLSVALLAGQWAVADVFHITLTDINGNPLTPNLLTLTNTQRLNTFQSNVTNTNPATLIVNTIATTATMLWNLFQLATGTLIFNILFYLGVPAILVTGLTVVYIIFLMVFVISAIYRFTI